MAGKRSCTFVIKSDWLLDAEIEEIVEILDDPLSLTSWWAPVFMRGEMLSGGDENKVGLTARFHTKGLLPHTFQFTARIDCMDESGIMRIRTWGDFDGRGDIQVTDAEGKAQVHICWQVTVHQPYIRGLIRLFKPVFTANHRWAMRRGREGLQAEIWKRRGVVDTDRPRFVAPTFPHNIPFVQNRFCWTRESINWARR